MGIFDKAKDLASEHSDKVDQGIDQAGDAVDQKTGSKYEGQVDQAQDFAKDQFGGQPGEGEPKPE
ncbi:antitoxin [Naumannella halotolerans]|uniref:Antitoxin protein of toxin-antitoxin system n=1 Tax=Naumannella halotolerans TaxID=993414 RepID=A0A4R7J7I4_9ACTN|nr:antitoxin [Naumannella halotolerans]TDT33195.1 antitoxin protein of toxin-antitoxin system [Naumannella halotolerans]